MSAQAETVAPDGQLQLFRYEGPEALKATLPRLIDESLRSYHDDRVAVFGEYDDLEPLEAELAAEYIDPRVNYHWSGIQRRAQKPWPRVMTGDYEGLVLLVHEVAALQGLPHHRPDQAGRVMLGLSFRGYVDGFLARLLRKPHHRVIVLEGQGLDSAAGRWLTGQRVADSRISGAFGGQQLRQTVLAVLYGTRLQRGQLRDLLGRTLWYCSNDDGTGKAAGETLRSLRAFVDKRYGSYLHLTEDGKTAVEGLLEVESKKDERPMELEKLFEGRPRRKFPKLPDKWLQTQVLELLSKHEWTTVPRLERLLMEHHERMRRESDWNLVRVMEDFPYLTIDQSLLLLAPSRPTIRRLLEKLVTMLVKDGMLHVFKRRTIETLPLATATIVDQRGLGQEQKADLEKAGSVVVTLQAAASASRSPEPTFDAPAAVERILENDQAFVRAFALAMGRSAVNATRRLAALSGMLPSVSGPLLREQARLLERFGRAPPSRFLVYEALIMKRYWRCFDLALLGKWHGSRKRSRFVRDHISSPLGRARGYSAVDAAINYMHQRRLFKAKEVSARLGLDQSCEGFLHRKRWNARGMGLLLDLVDPFKFADREKLVMAFRAKDLNWRDFYITTDRHGLRFYYPKPEAVVVMENLGAQADAMTVEYDGESIVLDEACRRMVDDLAAALKQTTPSAMEPFTYSVEKD